MATETMVDTKKLTLYAINTCPWCKKTKEYLDCLHIKYECVNVDELSRGKRQQIVAIVQKLNPALSFPTLKVGETVVVGFREKEIMQALKQNGVI